MNSLLFQCCSIWIWIALSLKLNGIRSTLFKGEFRSRQNKLMTGYEHIKSDIDKLEEFNGYVFDGELIRKNVDNISDRICRIMHWRCISVLYVKR